MLEFTCYDQLETWRYYGHFTIPVVIVDLPFVDNDVYSKYNLDGNLNNMFFLLKILVTGSLHMNSTRGPRVTNLDLGVPQYVSWTHAKF